MAAFRRIHSAARLVNAGLYARVSFDDGRQTVANQVQQLRQLATARQFPMVREYLDEETGASASPDISQIAGKGPSVLA